MNGKRILITGASRGLGRAIAQAAASAGGIVGANYLQSDGAAAELANMYPESISLLKTDIRDANAVKRMVKQFTDKHGGVDVLINNAAVHHPSLLLRKSTELIRDEIETNLLGAITTCCAVLPSMVKQRKGLIISISSVAAGYPRSGLATYTSSKAGLEAFTRSLALEYRSRGIRALSLRFAPIRTDMFNDLSRSEAAQTVSQMMHNNPISPSDAATIVIRFISDKLELQTGSVISFDDGYSLGQ